MTAERFSSIRAASPPTGMPNLPGWPPDRCDDEGLVPLSEVHGDDARDVVFRRLAGRTAPSPSREEEDGQVGAWRTFAQTGRHIGTTPS
jgi:hypothetical protein